MYTISDVTGIRYENEDAVFFRNYRQAAKYISWNAKLLDIFTDSNDKLVFVFERKTHNKLIKRWLALNESDGNSNG
jgi:hypothetical protein